MHRVIHTMLKHALQWGVVARNVATMVDAPRVTAGEIEILTPAQVGIVLDALRGKPPYPIVAVALATGLRRSELLALRWRDVDLDGGTLRVEQALEQTTRGGLVFRAPKTRHGRRTVTLAPSTVAVLREHYKAQLEQRLFFGLGNAPDDALVFTSWDGSPYLPATLTLQWRRAMQEAGLTATLHSLLHTHASTLIAAGLDMLTVNHAQRLRPPVQARRPRGGDHGEGACGNRRGVKYHAFGVRAENIRCQFRCQFGGSTKLSH